MDSIESFWDWAAADVRVGLLVFVRLAALVAVLPSMGGVLSIRIRLGLAIVLSGLVAPLVASQTSGLPTDAWWWGLAIEQAFVGAFLGGAMHLWLGAFAIAGSWIGALAGWGVGASDSDSGAVSGPGRLYGWLGGVVFLAMDGAHMAITALLDSFVALPVTAGTLPLNAIGAAAVEVLNQAFWLALRIGSPLLTSLIAASLAIAAIQRALPHVQLVRFQVAGNWLILLIALGLTLGLNAEHWSNRMDSLIQQLPTTLRHSGEPVAFAAKSGTRGSERMDIKSPRSPD